MYKKIILILMIILSVTVSGCRLRRPVPPAEPRRQSTPSPNLPEKDRLAKSPEENIEENINGVGIEEDLRITQISQNREENKISSLSQQQKTQVLENNEESKINTVIHQYNTLLPQGVEDKVQYNEYDLSFDYLLITAEQGGQIRSNPTSDSEVICDVDSLDKVSLLQRVEGEAIEGSNIWYRVACKHGNKTEEGYIHSSAGEPRFFNFDKMQQAIDELRQQLSQGSLHFISNYKNQNGAPPKKGEEAVDEHGYRVYHSAPAYEREDTNSSFRYIPDGMLVRLLGEGNGFYHVNVPTFGKDYYIPKQYIDQKVTLSKLNHVVVVDRRQQNQAAFEITQNGIRLVSYTLATTGFAGQYSFETTLGSYKAIEKRDRFEYLKSGTYEIAGYAPYAIRFTGGAYIHGVPVAYEEKEGEKIDPGKVEYLHTIGTFPRSNMCVRNFTSHAKFLHEWMDIRNGAVIVIE